MNIVFSFSPRPIYPKSWLWTEEEAAVVIQAAIRGFLVRCDPEVQELRTFWKVFSYSTEHNSIINVTINSINTSLW